MVKKHRGLSIHPLLDINSMNTLYIYLRSVINDFFHNFLLHTITMVTISLSLLVVCSFGLFFINISDVMYSWKKGIRIMAYLEDDTPETRIVQILDEIKHLKWIEDITYLSKNDALDYLSKKMEPHTEFLENLKDNPLPASFDIRIDPNINNLQTIKELVSALESIPEINDVEYGKLWLERITAFFNVFKTTCLSIGILLIISTLFVVSNTIRLVFYSRKEEIEIMKLMGATNWFIKAPFYLESSIQGMIGGASGLGVLYLLYSFLYVKHMPQWSHMIIQVSFFSPETMIMIIIISTLIGWSGCYLTLRQFLKL